MRRFSILGLMGCVLACGVVLAALRDANDIWASILGLATLAVLGVAVLRVVHRRDKKRAWWLGFVLFGAVYHLLSAAPWVAEVVRPKLPTTLLLDYVHSRVAGPGTGTFTITYGTLSTVPSGSLTSSGIRLLATNGSGGSGVNVANLAIQPAAAWQVASGAPQPGPLSLARFLPGAANFEPFQRVGHCLFALLAGLIGALISARMWARRERVEAMVG